MSAENSTATLELARGGDTGAFAQIVRQYQSLVSVVLYSATGDFHKSEDLAQETFLIAWQKLGDLRDTDHLAAWLCTIARNLAHRSHRKPTLPTQSLTDETGGLAPSALVSAAHAPDAELLRREQSELVWSAIGELDEKHRETLVLYYRSGQSASEIAAAMDLTEEAVWQRLARARKSLKAKLEEMVGSILTDTAPSEAFTLTVMTALGAAMFTSTAAQAAVVATTGTVAAGTAAAGTTAATGAATGGKALSTAGTATIWSVLVPAAFWGWFFAYFLAIFWAGVRNAPTLRARRLRVHAIFWCLQYYILFSIVVGVGLFPLGIMLFSGLPVFLLMFPLLFLVFIPLQLAHQRNMKKVVENDLGLPGAHVETYSYPQVERRFFLSLITNLLLVETIFAFLIGATLSDGSINDPTFLPSIFIGIIVVALITTIYYPIGRYFLEICRTKQNFLAAPPLVDNPLEVILMRTGKPIASVDRPRKTGGMFGVFLLVWIGVAGIGVWYFSHYSWDKHPIPLGICAALMILVFWKGHVLLKRTKSQQDGALVSFLHFVCIAVLIFVLEYIEFGSICFSDLWTQPREPLNAIRGANLGILIVSACHLPLQLFYWFRAGKEESGEKKSGRDELIREAIAQYDPGTMTEDEPEVAAKPFPKRWMWIIGLYAAAIVVMFCVGILLPPAFVQKKMLERNNDYTALIELEPDNAEWYYQRGCREFGAGRNPSRAYHDFSRAIELDSNFAAAYAQRSACLIDEHYVVISASRATLVDGEVVMVPMTGEEIKQSNVRQALSDINEAIRLEPNVSNYYRRRSSVHVILENFEMAERDLTESIRLEPTSLTYYMRGNFFENRKDFSKALADYTMAIELSAQEAAKMRGYSEFPLEILYRERGNLYKQLGELEKAAVDFEKAK